MQRVKEQLAGYSVKISADYKGDKESKWGSWHNNKVHVSVAGVGRTSFDFWGSQVEPEVRKPSALRFAVYCIISDARSGEMNFNDFCAEFGYDSDSRQAEATWKQCRKMAKRVDRVFPQRLQQAIAEKWG